MHVEELCERLADPKVGNSMLVAIVPTLPGLLCGGAKEIELRVPRPGASDSRDKQI